MPDRKPNVVFVITDDQGYGDMGCHGNDVIRTPAMDAMWAESVRLAERQLESSLLLQELGRAIQRDITEAQENLLAARDSLTAALVTYTIKRLRFWHAIERLRIDPKGMWYEFDSTREFVRGE